MLSPALGPWMSQLAPGRPVWLLSNFALTQITWLDVTVTQASSASPITARPCQLWMQRQTLRYSSLLGWDQYEAIQNVVTVWKQLHIYIRQSKLSKTKATNTKNRIKADVLTPQQHTWFRTIQAWDFTGLWWLSKLFPKKKQTKKKLGGKPQSSSSFWRLPPLSIRSEDLREVERSEERKATHCQITNSRLHQGENNGTLSPFKRLSALLWLLTWLILGLMTKPNVQLLRHVGRTCVKLNHADNFVHTINDEHRPVTHDWSN